MNRMQKKRMTLLVVIVFTFVSCFMPCDYPVDQVFEYNPKKAGAEIIARIPFHKADYVNYQNGQLYSLVYGKSEDTIKFFDLTNDNIIEKKTIAIPKTTFWEHYTYNYTQCVNIINDEMILLVNLTDNSTDKNFYSMLRFDENYSSLTFYDHSSDFTDSNVEYKYYYEYSLYYDSDTHNVYSVTEIDCNDKHTIRQYHYDESEEKFLVISDKTIYESGYVFPTHDYCLFNCYYVTPNAAVIDELCIYRDYNYSSAKKLNLTFLNLSYELIGAFFVDENLWLCAIEYNPDTRQYKYQLLKLKLLNTNAAENEYPKNWFWW